MRLLVCGFLLCGMVWWQAEPAVPPLQPSPGERWAVILVGIPGDREHEQQFGEISQAWENWLEKSLGFSSDHILRLPAAREVGNEKLNLTAEQIRQSFSDLTQKLTKQDSLWVLTLGHGNFDGKHAFFHVAGNDPSHEDFGRWLSEIRCREQVIWLTHPNSGWFVKPLAHPGRIVIAATAADDESNETEFPLAMATVMQRKPNEFDSNQDGQISVAEFFLAVATETLKRFESDKRLPTEHAQLDDDGDGRGAEEISAADPPTTDEPNPSGDSPATIVKPPLNKPDGALARRTFLPFVAPLKQEPVGPKPD